MALRDIRELTDSPEEYAEELRRRWGGLLSYRYIGRNHGVMNVGPADNTVTVRHDLRNATGGLLLSVIGIASPEGGAMTDLEDVPNPVIHSCLVVDPGRDVERFAVEGVGLHRGRQMGYSRSRIVDADDPSRVLAVTEGQGVSLGKPPEGLGKMEVEPIEIEDSPDLPPLWQVFGAQRRDDGTWALGELVVELGSPDGALHIGPQFVGLETAALDAAAAVAGTDRLQGMASHTMFLARAKLGPFRIESDPIAGADGTVVVRVTMHDEGNDDRRVTAGSYLFRAVD
jgi:hypothetical protein